MDWYPVYSVPEHFANESPKAWPNGRGGVTPCPTEAWRRHAADARPKQGTKMATFTLRGQNSLASQVLVLSVVPSAMKVFWPPGHYGTGSWSVGMLKTKEVFGQNGVFGQSAAPVAEYFLR
jgi:hypothetical protein